MSKYVERTTVSILLDSGEELKFWPPVSVWEAMRALVNHRRGDSRHARHRR